MDTNTTNTPNKDIKQMLADAIAAKQSSQVTESTEVNKIQDAPVKIDQQIPPVKDVYKERFKLNAPVISRIDELILKVADILKSAEGLESNIPINSPYWHWVREIHTAAPKFPHGTKE